MFFVCSMITFIHSFFKIDLPLKIIVSRTKIHILFTYFLSEIIQQITKNILFCWINKLEFDVFFMKNCLTWLDLAWMVRQKQSNQFHSTLAHFSRKLMNIIMFCFFKKTHDFKDFPTFFSLPTFCTYETNTISTQCRSFYKFSARYQFSYCVRVIKFYVFSKKS